MIRYGRLAVLAAIYLVVAHLTPAPAGVTPQGWRLSAIFIAVIIFMPLGLVPGFRALWQRWANRNKPKAPTPAAEPAE